MLFQDQFAVRMHGFKWAVLVGRVGRVHDFAIVMDVVDVDDMTRSAGARPMRIDGR